MIVLKVNDIVLYTAESYANSETVGTVDGYTVFVPCMLAGEQAKVRINYVKRNVAYADVVRLSKISDKRVEPFCKNFGKCGGCALSHMSYDEQLAFKRNKVANNLFKIAKMDVEVQNCVASPRTMGYRNKLSLPVGGKRYDVKAGMYRRNSHEVVDIGDCALGGEWSNTVTKLFVDYCNKEGVIPYDEHIFQGEARHLVARYVDGQLLATVVSNGEFGHDLTPFAEQLSKHFDKFGLFVNVNRAHNNVILGKQTQHVAGLRYIEGVHLGVRFRLRPNSFFQVNDGVKDLVYAKVRELLDLSRTEVLIDCFSGIGILTAILANDSFDTYAIEIEPSAILDAEEIVALNSCKRVTEICGDVTAELPKIVQANADKRLTVVVDPPRKGLGEQICRTLLQARPNNIVYISCDSATLARDLSLLKEAYDVTYVQPYDMFPHTDQVETVVRLQLVAEGK